MQIPADLRRGYEELLTAVPLRQLTDAAQLLSTRYRQPVRSGKFIQTDVDRLAYLAVRLPATYAAAHRVFIELQQRAPALMPLSLLDLGAGSGAATWAALNVFEAIQQVNLLEQDAALIRLGQKLAAHSDLVAWATAIWQQADLRARREFPESDLVVASFALNELAEAEAEQLALRAWQAARQALVIIEPGTMRGFGLTRRLREMLLAQGAHLLAPCPHAAACPMTAGDWCHFAARVERTALQRRLKEGALNYEDEKFSYLIFTKAAHSPAPARILRHPQRQAGETRLELCTPTGLKTQRVTKRDKEAWRRARKADWGDDW